ncbi:hypothetical protein PR048_013093 [Dryococelus australis]|uniref:Uncharacterized protein n=1 Tax=Dryococelus australis TaxID=614101 RepID=A0ABQ9HS22_9NEOP|nr:hypothetical protein PR048_013093 [Dryococelus australis]
MAESGLKYPLCCAFAPYSVDKMLRVKTHSRAIIGNLLLHTTLVHIILEGTSFAPEVQQEIMIILRSQKEWTPEKINSNTNHTSVQEKLNNPLSRLKDNRSTAVLWVQYFHMITFMEKSIAAQCCDDWQGYLSCSQQMILYFNTSGYFHYANCTHLYMQDILSLPNRHPDVKQQYSDFGHFSVNSSGTRWARVWFDKAIEQTLMCDMKSEGRLIRGRGLSDSEFAKWVGGTRTATAICLSLEVFASVHFMSGEQHVDFRVSRINIDDQDRGKLAQWLADHPPFAVRDSIMSLSTGVRGNSNINCHKAAEVGSCKLGTFVGTNFADMKQSKKYAVVPLAVMSNTTKVNNETLVVDSLMIFQRTLISKKRDEEVADLLKYELSPCPMTLFDEGNSVHLKTSYIVVDGGFLLNRVKWNVGTKFSSICEQYNKIQLIELLVETLTARRIEASTAAGDAVGSIERCGLNKVTSHSSVVVIGEDVDLLVLLTALTPPNRNAYVMNPGRGNIEDNVYPTRQCRNYPLVDLACSSAVSQVAPPSEHDLNNHRYNSFVKFSTKVKANLASQPQTKDTAKQHSFRVVMKDAASTISRYTKEISDCPLNIDMSNASSFSLHHLKPRVRDAIQTTAPDMQTRVWNEFEYRVDVVQTTRGGHIEQL